MIVKDGSSDTSDPAARLTTATRALARLSPTDIELWTDGSVAPGVGAGAGFAIYVQGLLYSTEAHPAGREVSDFRAEAVAMNMGLAAINNTIQDFHSHHSIRVLIASLLLTLFLVVQPANRTRSANQFGYIYPP